jgi:hypothetical protein
VSYSILNVIASCPASGRCGWCAFRVVLDDGRFAEAGVWVNDAGSAWPGYNADGSARALDVTTGLYTGAGARDTALWDVSLWGDYSPTVPGDPAAMAEVASAAADPVVASAVDAALSGQPVWPYAVDGTVTVFDSGVPTTNILNGVSYPATLTLSDGADSTPGVVTGAPAWSSSDPSFFDVVAAADGMTATVTGTGSGTADLDVNTGSVARPSFRLVSTLTCT